jgi:hypothetical protein
LQKRKLRLKGWRHPRSPQRVEAAGVQGDWVAGKVDRQVVIVVWNLPPWWLLLVGCPCW